MPRKITLRDGRVLHDERREQGPYRGEAGALAVGALPEGPVNDPAAVTE
jgi:hypothetical protein